MPPEFYKKTLEEEGGIVNDREKMIISPQEIQYGAQLRTSNILSWYRRFTEWIRVQ